jgi:hypothetical protein
MKHKRAILILLFIASAVYAGSSALPPVELTIQPSKATSVKQQYNLLFKADELTDGDAVPLYEQAAKSLLGEPQIKQVGEWLDAPLDKLPLQDVKSMLEQFKPAIQIIEQAAKCKQRNWPPIQNGKYPIDLSGYRKSSYVLSLKSRLEIANGQYEQAISTIQTGFNMARQVGNEAPNLSQALVGIAVGQSMSRELGKFIQAPDAPCLYQALRRMPQPFIDLSVPFKNEPLEIEGTDGGKRVRQTANRLDRHISALQCIEALRLYAGTHGGKFPDKLSDVTEVSVPADPVTKKPFSYSRTGPKAVLEVTGTEGSDGRDAVRYELNLKE